jgi:hypothetical protein
MTRHKSDSTRPRPALRARASLSAPQFLAQLLTRDGQGRRSVARRRLCLRTSPLAQICARVDYLNGLQENLKGQEAASEEVRAEFNKLVEQCRTALRDRAEEND